MRKRRVHITRTGLQEYTSELKSNVRPGDIIVATYNENGNLFNKIWRKVAYRAGDYGHMAVVAPETDSGDGLDVIEMTNSRTSRGSIVRTSSIRQFLSQRKGVIVYRPHCDDETKRAVCDSLREYTEDTNTKFNYRGMGIMFAYELLRDKKDAVSKYLANRLLRVKKRGEGNFCSSLVLGEYSRNGYTLDTKDPAGAYTYAHRVGGFDTVKEIYRKSV